MVQVAALIDPRLLIEIEVVAHKAAAPGAGLGWPA
jgi:enamine deaminase RidA (YjgF/YER057c/UK114 family)